MRNITLYSVCVELEVFFIFLFLFLGKQLRKLPRLTEADIITIKRPEIVRAKSNGRMGFAPLFEEQRRQKMDMLNQVVKIMKSNNNPTRQKNQQSLRNSNPKPMTTTTSLSPRPRTKSTTDQRIETARKRKQPNLANKRTTTTKTTTKTTTMTTTTKMTTTISPKKSNKKEDFTGHLPPKNNPSSHKIIHQPEEILGLPELPPEPKAPESPLFQISRVDHSENSGPSISQHHAPKSFDLSETDSLLNNNIVPNNAEKWQLIPPVQASKSIVRFRVDQEGPKQPILSLAPPPRAPTPHFKPPVSPFQIVGHVMTDDQLKTLPDSPIVNITNSNAANKLPKSFNFLQKRPILPPKRPKSQRPQLSIKRTGKRVDSRISLPVQLNTPGGGFPGPLVWISPSSLARSPMVNLRRLPTDGHHVRPANVERTLTMLFPGRQRRRFEKSCLTCLSKGGVCPHCLVVR